MPNYQPQIAALAREKVANREMFTAYDITCELRACGLFVMHEDTRQVVHALFAADALDIAYERTLVDVGGRRGPALLYHPYNADLSVYRARAASPRRLRLPL